MEDIKVYTVKEVADILQVTERSVYSYIKEGKLKAAKLGKYWRVKQENLNSFLDEGTK